VSERDLGQNPISGPGALPHGGLQRKREKTVQERGTEDFLRESRRELSKVHPHIYNADGTMKNN